ncbi:nuclear polyadenylated RNA-binding protein Nab2p [Diutina catenulata]
MFSPDDAVGQELKHNLTQELQRRYNVGTDAQDYADYIVMLMATGKSNEEVVRETNEISSDMKIDEPFVQVIQQEAQNIINRLTAEQFQGFQPDQQQQQQQQPPAQPEFTQPPQQPQPEFNQPPPQQPQQSSMGQTLPPPLKPTEMFNFTAPQPQQQNQSHPSFTTPVATSSRDYVAPGSGIPTKPRVKMNDGPKGVGKKPQKGAAGARGGVGKKGGKPVKQGQGPSHGNHKFGSATTAAAAVANLDLAMQQQGFNFANKSKGRCPQHPYCEHQRDGQCQLAHPTRECYSYPNCKNPPGTCNYLHPGEDQELMAKLKEKQQQYIDRRKQELQLQQAKCKYGANCNKDTCPFAHPTPANPQAQIQTITWCPQGKQCANPQCTMAHPPPANAKSAAQVESELQWEQCKFGPKCTNFKCPRRHAQSLVPCRSGAECRRRDCTFMHPINEPCRFGTACNNKNCSYQHPAGREIKKSTWVKGDPQFAVPDDQVMEQVSQG